MTQSFSQKIVAYIEQETPSLLAPYIQENEVLKLQNQKLQAEVVQLKQQLQLLQQKLQACAKQSSHQPKQIQKESPPSTHPKQSTIAEWFYQYVEAIELNNKQRLGLMKPNLHTNFNVLDQIIPYQPFIQQLCDIAKRAQKPETLDAILTVLVKTKQLQKNEVLHVLKNDMDFVDFLINSPALFNLKIQLFSLYELPALLKEYIVKMLKKHSSEVETTISDSQFAQAFWNAFLVDEEELFLKVYKHRTNWLAYYSATGLYFKAINPNSTRKHLHLCKQQLKQSSILMPSQLISVRSKINALRKDSKAKAPDNLTKKLFPKDSLYIIKDVEVQRFKKEFALNNGSITIQLSEANTLTNRQTVNLNVLLNKNKTAAYIAEKDFNSYKKKFSPLQLSASKNYYDFVWPSTELPQTKNTNSTEEKAPLNEESKLKKMGYHYTLSDHERWDILKKAVKLHGLQSIAYTLASITKRLKGRSPNSQAIVVWESDLQRLKQTFYNKRNFNWPTV